MLELQLKMRLLPDPHLSLRDASDFVFDSELGRLALSDPHPRNLAVLVRDVIAQIYRLTASCQLPEFTEHGLPHLCSLIDRICRWTLSSAGSPTLLEQLSPAEAGQLLLAVLFHDIGMLSQRPEDMPRGAVVWQSKGLRDVPLWVRTTHIDRMRALIHRSFAATPLAATLDDAHVKQAQAIAEAHGSWSWQKKFTDLTPRAGGLAAILAISDLLDEDSNRCDIGTLLNHRWGTHLNCAHWLRHGLTRDRVLVSKGVISVRLCAPPDVGGGMQPVFAALRNHFRLVLLYREALQPFGADGLEVSFNAATGCPMETASELGGWSRVPGFNTEAALVFHLLTSFMALGLLDEKRVSADDMAKTKAAGMEPVDLKRFHEIRGTSEPRSADEHVFRALTIAP